LQERKVDIRKMTFLGVSGMGVVKDSKGPYPRIQRAHTQGHRQKNFQGKPTKKRPKNSTIKPLPRRGEGNGKRPKIAKKDRKQHY